MRDNRAVQNHRTPGIIAKMAIGSDQSVTGIRPGRRRASPGIQRFRAVCAASILVVFAAVPASSLDRPNFLVLIADDAGWQDFGIYGNTRIRTPHIDRLAESGLVFDRAFLTIAQCSPSRISILTGKYPHATGAEDLHTPLPDGQVFVTTHLAKAGYATGAMKKTHFGANGDRQFGWYSEDTTKAFPEFLEFATDQPWFLWVGFSDPHRP